MIKKAKPSSKFWIPMFQTILVCVLLSVYCIAFLNIIEPKVAEIHYSTIIVENAISQTDLITNIADGEVCTRSCESWECDNND